MNNENFELKELLGLALKKHQENNFVEAKKIYEKILKINPKNFETNFYLGTLYAQNKNFQKAVEFLNLASEINPNLADLHNNLGLILREAGKLEEASTSIKKAIGINPNYAVAHSNLGLIYRDLGLADKAISCFEKSIEINSNHSDPYNNLGLIYKDLGNIEKAEEYFKKTISINNKNIHAYINLGNIYKNIGDSEKAEKLYKDSLNINPLFFDAFNNLMDLFERTNQNEKLNDVIVDAEKNFKSNPVVKLFYGQYLFKKQKFFKAIEILEKIKFDSRQSNRERLRNLILAKCNDQVENFTKAYNYFKKTNEINENNKDDNINKNKTLEIVKKRFDFFSKKEKESWSNSKNSNILQNPIFLVGFPRSGTTLLDTILRSHDTIEVIEEEPILGDFINYLTEIINGDLNYLKEIDQQVLKKTRDVYFSNMDKYIKDKNPNKIYIDKMPLNIIHVGEIVRIFPKAKFIVSLRHPIDSVLSCFMQSFKMNNAMANFLNLDDASNLYSKVMSLWIQYTKIPSIKYHYVKYEDVVTNFEPTIKNVLDFLEVPWSDKVFKFYKTAEKRNLISTPSYDQVNKPIYSKSMYRWKKYEKNISKIIPTLQPWIKKFNYK